MNGLKLKELINKYKVCPTCEKKNDAKGFVVALHNNIVAFRCSCGWNTTEQ